MPYPTQWIDVDIAAAFDHCSVEEFEVAHKYTKLRKDGLFYKVFLKVDQQAFELWGYQKTEDEALWTCWQLAKALLRAGVKS